MENINSNHLAESVKQSSLFSKLSGSIIHDLKNPLNNIHGFIQILKFDPAIQGLDKNLLEMMEKSCDKLNMLVSDLLEINKINSGFYKADYELFTIGKLLRDVIDQNLIAIYNKQLKIRIDFDDEFEALVDKQKITRVFENILSNAIKFSYSGNFIDIKLYKTGQNFCVEFKDYGTGIKKESLQLMCEPFSVKGEAGTNGETSTGFGLYISKYIISELHGGEISITNHEAKGTLVKIILPINL